MQTKTASTSLPPPLAFPAFLPQRLGCLDVALLALFRAAAQEDDQGAE
jgi:hypothetical protein